MLQNYKLRFIILLFSLKLNFDSYGCFYFTENDGGSSEGAISNPRIFITVSSSVRYGKDVDQTTVRDIELNWYNLGKELANNDKVWVGLFTQDPDENTSPKAKTYIRGHQEGTYTTNITYPYFDLNITKENNYCMGYWIALVKENKILVKNCYYARPNWMYEMRDTIGSKALTDLVIPGTHNAGSYKKFNKSQDNYKTNSLMCQDENIWNQLMYGIRFLDLRVTYRAISRSSEVFWISHYYFRMNLSVKEVLKTVKKFLDSTKEIVIIDFHLFHFLFDDNPNTYRKLIKLIEEEVGDYAITRDYGYKTSLNELWKNNKRLFIGFSSIHGDENLIFFPGVRHLWGNVENLNRLKTFFERTVCRQSRNTLWSAMAELTPSLLTHLSKFNGLRQMAQDVNLEITRWFRDQYWNCANIISTDYFLGNDIINVAIESNKRRFD